MKLNNLFPILILLILIINSGCSTEKGLHNVSFSRIKHHSIPDENIAIIKKPELSNEFEKAEESTLVISPQEEVISGKPLIFKGKEIKKVYQHFKKYYKPERKNVSDDIPTDHSGKTNSLATIAFITGLLSIVFSLAGLAVGYLAIAGLLCAIAAVCFGPAALKRINRSSEKGKGLALAGIIIGWTVIIAWILLIILVIIAIALLRGTVV